MYYQKWKKAKYKHSNYQNNNKFDSHLLNKMTKNKK